MVSKRSDPETRRARQEHREAILAAAAELVATRGYSGATMQAIAGRAGCSVGYLYRHFAGKLVLTRQLVERELDALQRIGEQVAALGLPPLAAYRRRLEETSRHLAERRPLVRVLARESVLLRLPEIHRRFRRHRRQDLELLREARRCGELPASLDLELVAAALQGAVDALARELVERDDPDALLQLPDLVFSLIIDPLRTG